MTNLEELYLDSNNLSGIVEMGMIFSELSKLSFLHLSANSLSIANNRTTISTSSTNFPKFHFLFLSSCNIIGEFPDFLKSQDQLVALDLSNNKIEGQIPKWFWSSGIETLSLLNLSHNYISNLEQAPLVLPWKNLFYLDLHSNMLQGPFVVPPLSTSYFFISKNNLTGKIHPLFCKLSHLEILDVSYNQLGGSIPHCLARLSSSLLVLNLQRNNFHGNIPQPCREGSKLKTLELSHNQLQGNVPKSLIKCSKLEFLNFGHNQISDKFPSWLENLPELQVLVLRSNKFHGPIWNGQKHFSFSKLRIIDLSFNNFSGNIPLESFRDWLSMTRILDGNKSQLSYMGDDRYDYYQNSVTVMSKGLEMVLVKIVTLFNSIDLSNNRFEGEIPSSIGDLQYLIVLNLSSNSFTGLIPSSLGNLTELESLDLSRNQLSGGIPQQLLSLTFLSHLNLSHNQLTGQIPQGRQFDTFPSSSFVGNLGLCGPPLLKKCENVGTPTPHPTQESNTGNINFGWKVVAVGYGCGMIIGVFIEHLIAARKPTWFLRSFLGILYR